MTALDPMSDPRFKATLDLIARTGATEFQIRYNDDDEPIIWMALAAYKDKGTEVAASLNPVRAVLRLAETLVDGGVCRHCKRPAGLDPDSLETMPGDDIICWYQFDPELKKFRRGCEGDEK